MIRLTAVGLSFAILFGICSSAESMAQEYTIRFSAPIESRSDISSLAAVIFQKEVESTSQGRIKVQLFFGSQLGSLPAITDQMKDGTIQMNAVGFPFLAKYVPDVGALQLPFLFESRADAYKVLDGSIGDDVRRVVLERSGIRILAIGEFGFVQIMNSKRPIRGVADISGLKLRTTPSPIAIATFRQLNAIPAAIDLAELYTGIQRGALDGADVPISSMNDLKYYEVAKYLTKTNHFFQALCFNINNKFFQTLPPDLRAVVEQAAIKARDYTRAGIIEKESKAIEIIKSKGVQVIGLSPDEFENFRNAVQPLYEAAKTKFFFGEDGVRWVTELTRPQQPPVLGK